MGTVQHKYTREYFTGRTSLGEPLHYGVEGYSDFLDGKVRLQDFSVLKKLRFIGKNVLEFGFGRGEVIKYVLESGAGSYVGVDFSSSAHDIACEFLQNNKIELPTLHNCDAICYINSINEEQANKFDIILMFDVIEHLERRELFDVLSKLSQLMKPNAILAINTPVFQYDHDCFIDGVDTRNNDPADTIPETMGMHCNKYTLASLKLFMEQCGFISLSEAHFFVPKKLFDYPLLQNRAFALLWDEAKSKGCPLLEYEDDSLEYAFHSPLATQLHCFSEGRMTGLTLKLHEDYVCSFKGGTHDEEMFAFISSLEKKPAIVFDVGGFMGVSSLLFSRCAAPGAKIYCFEPNPWNLIRIQSNLSHNIDEAKNIVLYPYALGNEKQTSTFLVSKNIDNGYSSTSRLPHSHVTYTEYQLSAMGFVNIDVEITTLDAFVAETGILPDLIKVDVEGYEHFLLEGAVETLQKSSPMLLIEFHSPFCAMKCTLMLNELGYTLSVLHEEEDNRLIVVAQRQNEKMLIEPQSLHFYRHDENVAELSFVKRALNFQKQKIHSLKIDNSQFQNTLFKTQTTLTQTQASLTQTQAELTQTQIQLAETNRILSHPVIRAQRKLWRTLKFWS